MRGRETQLCAEATALHQRRDALENHPLSKVRWRTCSGCLGWEGTQGGPLQDPVSGEAETLPGPRFTMTWLGRLAWDHRPGRVPRGFRTKDASQPGQRMRCHSVRGRGLGTVDTEGSERAATGQVCLPPPPLSQRQVAATPAPAEPAVPRPAKRSIIPAAGLFRDGQATQSKEKGTGQSSPRPLGHLRPFL